MTGSADSDDLARMYRFDLTRDFEKISPDHEAF
jgi:hypothetical protein